MESKTKVNWWSPGNTISAIVGFCAGAVVATGVILAIALHNEFPNENLWHSIVRSAGEVGK